MRILRIKLANYRGVDTSEVEFGISGLTIIEGPNEIGKTSIAEAIGILFDYHDSSKHRIVDAIKPVHLDVGAEVELEAKCGQYHFCYSKRFNKKCETKLRIISPSPESLTGREAHDKAVQILQETIDVNLWKALRIQQGDAIKQADLSNQTSLSAALDLAAGGGDIDPREESVFDRARTEYLKYFTEKGSDKKPVKDALGNQEILEAEVNSLTVKILGLEKDVVKSIDLVGEVSQTKIKASELKVDREKYLRSLEEINKLQDSVEKAKLQQESSQKSAADSERRQSDRLRQIEDSLVAKRNLGQLGKTCIAAGASIQKAEDELNIAELETEKSEKLCKDAEDTLSLRRSDAEYFNDRLHLDQLRERRERIDRSREDIHRAREALAKNMVDAEMLDGIQSADQSLAMAEARLQAGSPSVLMKGLGNVEVIVDGSRTSISKGEEKTISVSDHLQLQIPDSLEITLSAGSDSSRSLEQCEAAKRALTDVCKRAVVKNVREARAAYDKRRDAEQSLESHRDIEKAALRDLSYNELTSKFDRLSISVPKYEEKRKQEPRIPANLDEARKKLMEAVIDSDKAISCRNTAKSKSDEIRSFCMEKKSLQREEGVKFEIAKDNLEDYEDDLSQVRIDISDNELSNLASQTAKHLQEASEVLYTASQVLQSKDPEKVNTLFDTTEGSLKTVSNRLEVLQKESSEVRGRLKALGEEGLQEKLNSKVSELEHISNENQAMTRRAEASKLLYKTLRLSREDARRAYIAPLKEKIESLGRLVFNDSFQVELTEDLSVANRTLDGSTVTYESLSGGTKEQVSLIARLACSMIVSDNGGAPLILDDELGYTDNDRLKLMGAIIARAGKECQVIILTCVPDRYSNIGNATVVRLS